MDSEPSFMDASFRYGVHSTPSREVCQKKLTDSVIAGEEQKKSLVLVVHHLRMSHYAFVDIFKGRDVVGAWNCGSGLPALVGPSGDKDPDVAILVDLDGRVVVRVVTQGCPLSITTPRLSEHPRAVVIATDHSLSQPSRVRTTAIDE